MREQESIEGAEGSTAGQYRGAAGGNLKWPPPSMFELLSLFYCRLNLAT